MSFAPDIRVLEYAGRTAPLGVRFFDAIAGSIIFEGLSLSAWPVDNAAARRDGAVNRSGTFYFVDLPGLRDAEFGAGDDDYWAAVTRKAFVVEVFDRYRRFLPFSFGVALPNRGILDWSCAGDASPPANHPPRPVPLYSAPPRPVPSGVQVIRAELRDPIARAPAAFAVVEAHIAGEPVARGIADEQGRLALLLPAPRPIEFSPGDFAAGSPPDGPPLDKQSWAVELRAFFAPSPPARFPDLCATLAQPAARLWADEARTTPLPAQVLRYGRESIIRTAGALGALPQLYITPGP